jgi:hypothetical protein
MSSGGIEAGMVALGATPLASPSLDIARMSDVTRPTR